MSSKNNTMSSKELLGFEKSETSNMDPKLEQLLCLKKSKKPSSDGGPPKTFKVQPSSVLSSVKQFLPLMEEANKKLTHVPTDDVDIECISDNADQVIEMDFALFQQSDDDASSGSSEESSDDITYGEVTEENIKITSRKSQKPCIEEMDRKDEQPG